MEGHFTLIASPCFSALTLLVWRQEGHPASKETEWWDAGMVMCLSQGANLHMAQLMPLPLTISCSSKSRLFSPFWCRLTRVVPYKNQEGRNMVVCGGSQCWKMGRQLPPRLPVPPPTQEECLSCLNPLTFSICHWNT